MFGLGHEECLDYGMKNVWITAWWMSGLRCEECLNYNKTLRMSGLRHEECLDYDMRNVWITAWGKAIKHGRREKEEMHVGGKTDWVVHSCSMKKCRRKLNRKDVPSIVMSFCARCCCEPPPPPPQSIQTGKQVYIQGPNVNEDLWDK
jgi:hypothetical protein